MTSDATPLSKLSIMGNMHSKETSNTPDSEEKYSLRGTPSRAASRAEKTQKPMLDATISVNTYPSYKHSSSTHLHVQHDAVKSEVEFYGLAVEDWCHVGPSLNNPYVAAVGGNVAIIHQYKLNKLVFVQNIVDFDKEEIYYTCVWTKFKEHSKPKRLYAGERVLIFGGKLGILNVYSINRKVVIHRSTSHHGEINDLAVHPLYSHIVATASSDDSVHLYNVQEELIQLARFEVPDMSSPVQSVCFTVQGNRLVSGDMAHQIIIWKTSSAEIKELDTKAQLSVRAIKKNKKTFSECDYVTQYTAPEFVTCSAGTQYIDCIQVLGDNLILSKTASTDVITMWQLKNLPAKQDESMYATSLREDKLDVITELQADCDLYWWDRFAYDPSHSYVVCGSEDGVVYLWDLFNLKSHTIPPVKYKVPIENRKANKLCHIRQVAFSPNGKCLFALDSTNQTIHTFHLVESKPKLKK